MNRTRAATMRAAVAILLMASGVSASAACSSGSGGRGGGPSPQPPPGDEAVLASFVDSEKKLDAGQLATALQAGEDLTKAGDAVRTTWEAGRKRLLSSLGPKGVVQPASASDGTPAQFTPAEFDFASMAWATWSLGLLYLGNDASGTSTHGPTASGDVTTSESLTIVAAKQGPVASVKLSTTHTLTSKQGWSVAQTGTVELVLPLCPDNSGVIAFDIHLELKTTGSSGTGATSTVTDTLAGHTVATVNDDANLATIQITGSYDHNAAGAAASGVHVDVTDGSITAKSNGDVPDAQVQEARTYGAILLRLAGSLAAARAGDFYEHGYCTEVVASPNRKPTEVAVGATQPFDVRVRHKWDNVELTDRITARLDGTVSVSPTGRTATPTTLKYVAPKEKNRRATIRVEARSKRGVALADIAVKTPGGYAIHDTWQTGAGPQHMDGVSCDSPYGPWHVVISADLAAAGLTRLDAYYDITLDPATGTGPVRGEEHSATTDGFTADGTQTGTAELVPDGDNYVIKMELDDNITLHNPRVPMLPGQDRLTGHKQRQLRVTPATEKDCG